jgi:hypothetical protein
MIFFVQFKYNMEDPAACVFFHKATLTPLSAASLMILHFEKKGIEKINLISIFSNLKERTGPFVKKTAPDNRALL